MYRNSGKQTVTGGKKTNIIKEKVMVVQSGDDLETWYSRLCHQRLGTSIHLYRQVTRYVNIPH